MENYLMHEGVGHLDNPPGPGSGRYHWGSGKNPHQHQDNLQTLVNKLRKQGLTDKEIAQGLFGEHATARDVKTMLTIERERERSANRQRALSLYEQYGNVSEVARIMYGDSSKESSVRSLLNDAIAEKHERYQNTADFLKERIKNSESGIIDVGSDTELYMGVTKDVKKVAIKMLEEEGYVYTWVKIPQPNGNELVRKVLASPDMEWKDIQANKYNVDSIVEFTSPDGGITWNVPKPPVSIDGKRVFIRYGNEGGTEKDGTIELRRGVDDISLGGPNYAQVRIAVDGKYYMKGMAFYSDNIPDGFDMVYNVNKKTGTPIEDVYKKLKDDKDNPFGATIKAGGQPTYIGADGKEHQGVINKLSEEGDWSGWSKNIASQFLSKQNIELINKQLQVSILDKQAELAGIMNLTNPIVKQKLLSDYAEQTDANATSLSAKAPKGSAFQVLIPITSLKDNEIYAPNYDNGDKVALVRYPHGGIFEIPILTVNNKNKEGDRVLTKNAKDAVGINQKTAEILSGADFDGDTAIVIPLTSTKTNIINRKPLEGLVNFDHKSLYKLPDSAPEVKNSTKQREMGIVTNLITDMTVAGASFSEIERAVKHSMVVIDAEKHHLDIRASAKDNKIEELKKLYQGSEDNPRKKGASTILSRASSEEYVNQRKEITDTKKMTDQQKKDYAEGKKIFVETGKLTSGKQLISDPAKMTSDELKAYNAGKKVYRDVEKTLKQEKISRMQLTDDATTLVRDKNNQKEMAYANYANQLKSLANQARKEARNLDLGKADPVAKQTYSSEVKSLDSKLRIAQLNAPKERQAVALGTAVANEKIKDSNIELDYEHRQRIKAQSIDQARAKLGAKKETIKITDKEWEAIQSHAVSPTKLKSILNNADQDRFKELAMPKNKSTLTSTEISLIRQLKATGQYTNKEIANKLNVSSTTVSKYLNE